MYSSIPPISLCIFYCYAFVYYSCVSQSNNNHWPRTWMARLVAAGLFIKRKRMIMTYYARCLVVALAPMWSILCANSACAEIGGYFSSPSAAHGGAVNLHTSTDAATYTMRIYLFN